MICVLSALALSQLCNLIIMVTYIINYSQDKSEITLEKLHRALREIGGIDTVNGALFFSATWAMCFKYWQTAFEMNFLFRFETE